MSRYDNVSGGLPYLLCEEQTTERQTGKPVNRLSQEMLAVCTKMVRGVRKGHILCIY